MITSKTQNHYPLSSPQIDIWFDQILHPDVPLYNIGGYVRIEGTIDPAIFEKALNQVIEENDALRIIIHAGESLPTQTFAENVHINLDFQDFSAQENAHESALKWMAQEFVKPFQLYDGLLFQFVLCKAEDNCYYWLKKYHHLIVDGWAISLIVQRVAAAYNALATGQTAEQKNSAYPDFIQNDQAYFDSEKFVKAKHYWQEKYSEVPEPLLVHHHGAHTMKSQRSTLHLKCHFFKKLIDFAKENNSSTFHLILGALYCYFVRTCDREDLVIGLPTLNRSTVSFKQTVGIFTSVIPAGFRFGTDLSFIELMRSIGLESRHGSVHQRFPLGEINRQLGLARKNRQQLFDLTLSYMDQNYETNFAGNTIEFIFLPHGFEQTALAIFVERFHEQRNIRVNFDYNLGFFDADEIEHLKARFEFILGEILRQPSVPIRALQIMPDTELKKVLVEWNNTATDYSHDKTLVDLFEEQVAKTPEAIAVVFENQQLTYRGLNTKANRLAHYLQTLGVKPEVLVGICVERSIEMVIGIFGILKAGGAYVPLDPAYPNARLAFMLEDAQVPVLLTQSSLKEKLPETKAHLVCLDIEAKALSQYSEENFASGAKPLNLAYVIYTSGSTGNPKAVLIVHQGLCNLAQALIQVFGVHNDSRILQFASLSFDASTSEIAMSLGAGAQLCLAKKDDLLPGPNLIQLLRKNAITHVTLPPTALAVLPIEDDLELQHIIVAGESCSPELAARWSKGRRFFNAYGPTEGTVCATVFENTTGRSSTLPIGRPIANTQIYILDNHQMPVPIGIPGELHIGGAGVARGYLNRPDLTAEKFINNPFNDDPNSRLYKTGDLARYFPDGNIEFMGRIDNQVKIRGFRIELDEIGAVLSQHPRISEAVVVHDPEKKCLNAYLTQGNRVELWPSIAEFYVYDDIVYRSMATHESRNRQYLAAFQRLLPGKTVVEIGPGPEVILSRLALQAGAQKIYAIELLEDSYHKAQDTLIRLGISDKITLIHGDATLVTLPEPVDYCISEIVGSIGGSEGAAVIINNARRFLKDGRNMIPQRSITKIAALSLPESQFDYGFVDIAAHYTQKIFEQVGYSFDLRLCVKNLPLTQLISNSDVFEELNYTHPINLETRHEICLRFNQNSRFTGLLVWLTLHTDTDHIVDILTEQHSWLPVYLPLFTDGKIVKTGDRLVATITRQLCDNHFNPDYLLEGTLYRQGQPTLPIHYHSYHLKPHYRAHPFYQKLFADNTVPVLSKLKLDTGMLRDYLSQYLPDYMIPNYFTVLKHLPLTPNGKIDRRALSQLSVSHEISGKPFVAPRTPDEELLANIWASVLGVERVGIHDNFFELGGDSIISIQMISRANQVGLQLTPRQLFQHQTIADIAKVAKTALSRNAEQGLVTGEVPLTPIQHWFFEQEMPDNHHFNQAFLFKVSPKLQPEQLEPIVKQLLQHHDALRLRFYYENGGCSEALPTLHSDNSSLITVKDLSELTAEEQRMMIESTAAELQTSLNIEDGPILRMAWFQLGFDGQPNRLFWVIHHLAVDGVSWRILLEDFITAYQQLTQSEKIVLPPKTTSFQQWAKRLTEYAISDTLNAELDYWLTYACEPVKPLLVDYSLESAANTVANVAQVNVSLNVEQTRALLSEVPKAYRTQINDVLLTALLQSFAGWTGEKSLLIDLEGHGREELFEDIDLSRTVGWFTSLFPVLLDLRTIANDTGAALKAIKEQLRRIPHHGIGYGLLKYLNPEAASQLQALPQAQVSFNYLGQFHQFSKEPLLGLAPEESGALHSTANPRSHLLEINGLISEGQLHFSWDYNENYHRRSTIERLAQDFITALQVLIAHCQSPEVWDYTPSDFPLARLQQPFFCVPGIGGHVTSFYELAQKLGKEQPFYGLEAVGLDGKSKPYTKIEDMATHYIKEMQTVQPQGPYLLGGHSFGALVAFEMSQQLQKQGHEVALLAILDMMAPHLFNKLKGSESQLNYLLQRFKKASFLPPYADKTDIQGFVDVYKANSQMSYVPQNLKPTRITLFQASELIEWTAWNETKLEQTWGWHQYAEGSVDTHIVPGDHHTMMNQPNVQVLAEKLKVCLEQALAI